MLAATPAAHEGWDGGSRLAVRGALGGALAEFLKASRGEQLSRAVPPYDAGVAGARVHACNMCLRGAGGGCERRRAGWQDAQRGPAALQPAAAARCRA